MTAPTPPAGSDTEHLLADCYCDLTEAGFQPATALEIAKRLVEEEAVTDAQASAA